MTDPVDTDALRSMASANDYNMGPFVVAAADEVDRLREVNETAEAARSAAVAYGDHLRAVIENAPHDHGLRAWCRAGFSDGPCTCWKADVL